MTPTKQLTFVSPSKCSYLKLLLQLFQMSSSALCIAMAVLPLVLVEAKEAPHMSEMKEVKDFAISPSELFAKRYSDLVSDCIEWGVI